MNNTIINLALLNGVIYAMTGYVARVNDFESLSLACVFISMIFTIPAVLMDDKNV